MGTAVPALLVGGLAWMTTLSSFNVMVQLSAANWVKARALGSWGWGHAAEAFGTRATLGAAGIGLLLSLELVTLLRLPSDLNRDLSPLPNVQGLALAPGLQPGSGFVAVTVEYRIEPE